MYHYKAKLVRVIDGDTAVFNVDLGFYIKVEMSFRFAEINTPERGHVDYYRAKAKLEDLLKNVTEENGEIEIKTAKADKYGRWLVYINGVNEELKKEWPYD